MALKALKYLYRGPLQNRQYIDDELSLIEYPHKNIKNSVLVFVINVQSLWLMVPWEN